MGYRIGYVYIGFEHFSERVFLSNDRWKIVCPKENKVKWKHYLNIDRSEKYNVAGLYPD